MQCKVDEKARQRCLRVKYNSQLQENDWEAYYFSFFMGEAIQYVKSLVNATDAIRQIALDHDKWNVVSVQFETGSATAKKFHKLIPKKCYRHQIMHHCATSGIRKVLYVEAT